MSFGYDVQLFFIQCCVGHGNNYIEDFCILVINEIVENLPSFVGFCFLLIIFLLSKLLLACRI